MNILKSRDEMISTSIKRGTAFAVRQAVAQTIATALVLFCFSMLAVETTSAKTCNDILSDPRLNNASLPSNYYGVKIKSSSVECDFKKIVIHMIGNERLANESEKEVTEDLTAIAMCNDPEILPLILDRWAFAFRIYDKSDTYSHSMVISVIDCI